MMKIWRQSGFTSNCGNDDERRKSKDEDGEDEEEDEDDERCKNSTIIIARYVTRLRMLRSRS